MSHFEQKLHSQLIYEGRIISLRKDEVRLENENTALREVVQHPGGVAVVAVDENGHMLFVRQYRYPVGQELLEIPAGKLNYGEDPKSCGLRELEEETGCRPSVFLPLGKLLPTPAYVTEVIHLYYATGLTQTAQHLDEDEFLSVERIPVEEAVRLVLSGEIIDAKTQIGVLKYKAMRDAGLLPTL